MKITKDYTFQNPIESSTLSNKYHMKQPRINSNRSEADNCKWCSFRNR